jgi:hypothetical protein
MLSAFTPACWRGNTTPPIRQRAAFLQVGASRCLLLRTSFDVSLYAHGLPQQVWLTSRTMSRSTGLLWASRNIVSVWTAALVHSASGQRPALTIASDRQRAGAA